MRNITRLISTAFFAALFIGGFAAVETKAQGVIGEIYSRMEAHANALSSFKADVTMSKHDSVLDDYELKKGKIAYLPGKGRNIFLRIDWTEPFREVLLIARGRYVLYQPRIKQAIVGKVNEAGKKQRSGNILAFMTMSKKELNANYRPQYIGVEKVGGKEMWHLKLFPRKKADFKNADLWVDGNGMPIQAKIMEKNDDSTTILLRNLQKNVTIPGKVFTEKLSKDVAIIDG